MSAEIQFRLNDEKARINFVQLRLNEIEEQLNSVTEALRKNDWALLKRMIDAGVSTYPIKNSQKVANATEGEKREILNILSERYDGYDIDVLLMLRNEYSMVFTNDLLSLYRELLQMHASLLNLISCKTCELTTS